MLGPEIIFRVAALGRICMRSAFVCIPSSRDPTATPSIYLSSSVDRSYLTQWLQPVTRSSASTVQRNWRSPSCTSMKPRSTKFTAKSRAHRNGVPPAQFGMLTKLAAITSNVGTMEKRSSPSVRHKFVNLVRAIQQTSGAEESRGRKQTTNAQTPTPMTLLPTSLLDQRGLPHHQSPRLHPSPRLCPSLPHHQSLVLHPSRMVQENMEYRCQ